MRVGVEGLGPLHLPVEVAEVQRPAGHCVRRACHRHDAHVAAGLGGRLSEERQEAPDEGVVADKIDAHLQLEAVLGPTSLICVRGKEAATYNDGRRRSYYNSFDHNQVKG